MERMLKYTAKFDGSVEENLKSYGFSSRVCTMLKRELGLVKVNGKAIFVVDRVNKGDEINIIVKETPIHIEPYNMPVNIVLEDEDIAVIDKPQGIASISTTAHYNMSLMNALAVYWGDYVYHPVTRLDKGTSGLMLIAKHGLAHSLLNSELSEGNGKKVNREYLAVVTGELPNSGTIDAPIAHIDKSSYRRVVDSTGKRAVTEYRVVERIGKYSLVRLKLHTGRTHQIRIHMSHIGCPLVGDTLYGGIDALNRPALHSAKISFCHPITGVRIELESELPSDIAELIKF